MIFFKKKLPLQLMEHKNCENMQKPNVTPESVYGKKMESSIMCIL